MDTEIIITPSNAEIRTAIQAEHNRNSNSKISISQLKLAAQSEKSKLLLPICKHSEELYPDLIVQLLVMQSKGMLNIYGRDFDKACETIMIEWIHNNVQDKQEYVRTLISTLKSEDCAILLATRLQAELVKADEQPIVINTRYGSVVSGGHNIDRSLKNKIRLLMAANNIPTLTPEELDRPIRTARNNSSIEQTILSWIACVIVKSVLNNYAGEINSDSKPLSLPHFIIPNQ